MKLIFTLTFLAFTVQTSLADEVADAYRAIPHAQTTYRSSASTLSTTDAGALQSLFQLTDQALVLRVAALQWLSTGGKSGKNLSSYERDIKSVMLRLRELTVPGDAEAIRNTILSAVEEQREFLLQKFQQAENNRTFAFDRNQLSSPLVQSSHRKLISAYNSLMSKFGSDSPHNKQAFYDHLCALDFL